MLEEGDPESERLDALAEELPYETVILTLDEKLRVCDPGMDVVIARAACSMMVRRYPDVARALASGTVVSKPAGVMKAVRRTIDLLRAWTNHRNEIVCFYAAKGLWGADPGLAAQTLRRLKVGGG